MPWFSNGIWLCWLVLAGTFIAVGSAYMQRAGLSPVVISSLLVGAVLGVVAGGLAWIFDARNRRLLFFGTVIAGLFVAGAQHVFLHRLTLLDWEQAQLKEPQLSLFRDPPPEDLRVYLRQQSAGGRMWLWLLDAALITATGAGVAIALQNHSRQSNMESG